MNGETLQLSVFLENRAGCLEQALSCLNTVNMEILALSLADSSDFGILRLLARDFPKAEEALRKGNFTVGRTEVVSLAIADKPGALLRIVALLSREGINIEYMYTFPAKEPGNTGIVLRFDKMDLAKEILKTNGYL